MNESEIKEHIPTLELLVTLLNLKEILELGTGQGISTLALVKGAQTTGGHVTTIDIKQQGAITKSVLVDTIESDDLTIDWNQTIDLLFIDADHSYEHVYAELEKYEPFVRQNGIIALHDTNNKYQLAVRKALQDYLKSHIKNKRIIEYRNCYGLTIIQKT